jgi:hypothetical protein
MRFALWFPTFVGLVYLPHIGPTFLVAPQSKERHFSLPNFLLSVYLKSSSPQMSLEDMKIIYAIFAGLVIREGSGKLAILRCLEAHIGFRAWQASIIVSYPHLP